MAKEIAERKETCFSRLNELLVAIRKREKAERYIETFLRRICKLGMAAGKIHPSLLLRGFREIRRRFPLEFSFYVVEPDGSVVPGLTDGMSPRTVLKYLTQAVQMSEIQAEKLATGIDRWRIIQSFIGPQSVRSNYNLSESDKVKEVAVGEDRHFFFFSVHKAGCIFVHLSKPAGFSLFSVDDLIARIKRRGLFPDVDLGVFDSSSLKDVPKGVARAIGHFKATNQNNSEIDNTLFSLMRLGVNHRLVAFQRFSEIWKFQLKRLAFVSFLSVVFTFCLLFTFQIMVQNRDFSLPIRWRLIILFGFSSGLPVSVLIFIGWGYFSQLYQSRVTTSVTKMEKALWAFDERFPELRNTLEAKLNEFLKTKQFGTPDHQRKMGKFLTWVEKKYQPSNIYLFDTKGKPVWQDSQTRLIKSPSTRNLLGQFVRSILSNLNQEVNAKIDAALLVAETVSEGENPISMIMKNVGKLNDLSLDKNKMWSLLIPIKDSEGGFSNMAVFLWRKFHLERFYLQENLISSGRVLPGLRMLAFSPKRKPHLIPQDNWTNRNLRNFFQDLRVQVKSLTLLVPQWRGKELVIGIRPKEITEYFLVGRMSDGPIRHELFQLKMKLAAFIISIILISWYLGWILSRRFLAPVGKLTAGVEAIGERFFSYRLPSLGNDEFGVLGKAFNKMMEDLADLEVARIVQESLLPNDEITHGEYQIYGASHAATQLGGDFFDLKKLNDRQILVAIGDVTGHGVPAALIMTMAKSALELTLEASTRPEILIAGINRVIFRTMRRKRLMTCIVGILDVENHILHLSNAGHNYPYSIKKGEKPALHKCPGTYPLGTLEKAIFNVESIAFRPGDGLFFYTDGIVECQTSHGPIGYTAVGEKLAELRDFPPKSLCKKLFAWYLEQVGQRRQEDDITLIMIQRDDESR